MTKTGRRLALVGTVNRDTISRADGSHTESYGGLLYSVLPLAQIVSADTEIYPICDVGEDMEEVVRSRLSPYPTVRMDGLRFVPGRNPHCTLEYDAEGNKQETLEGDIPTIEAGRFGPYLDCDAICVNFITGLEMSLATLQGLRRRASALICMDVHSLTLGMDKERRRYWRLPEGWEAWLACADVVQLNEREAGLLAGEALDSPAATQRFGEGVLSLGPTLLHVTRGEHGSDMAFTDGDGRVTVQHFPAEPSGTPVDETGCGDVFLVSFIWHYLDSEDPEGASRFANRMAGVNCCLKGIDGIVEIGSYVGSQDPRPA